MRTGYWYSAVRYGTRYWYRPVSVSFQDMHPTSDFLLISHFPSQEHESNNNVQFFPKTNHFLANISGYCVSLIFVGFYLKFRKFIMSYHNATTQDEIHSRNETTAKRFQTILVARPNTERPSGKCNKLETHFILF